MQEKRREAARFSPPVSFTHAHRSCLYPEILCYLLRKNGLLSGQNIKRKIDGEIFFSVLITRAFVELLAKRSRTEDLGIFYRDKKHSSLFSCFVRLVEICFCWFLMVSDSYFFFEIYDFVRQPSLSRFFPTRVVTDRRTVLPTARTAMDFEGLKCA